MRISKAIDKFLDAKQLEGDWSDRSLDGYRRILGRLTDPPPRGFGPEIRLDDFDSHHGTEKLRDHIAHNWGATSSATRANVISVHHSFFAWALEEAYIDLDPSHRIKRPPRRKPDVYRPPIVDIDLGYDATLLQERGAWVLMSEVGLRAATVVSVRWGDMDLQAGRITVLVKGGDRLRLPLSPVAVERLQEVYRQLEPAPDDHVFTVERQVFEGNRRVTRSRDPKRPAATSSLTRMVHRVCRRAGVREFGPHALRHGFANRFLRDSGRDAVSLQQLMGHKNYSTTQHYLQELELEDLDAALERASEGRTSVGDADYDRPSYKPTGRFRRSGPGRSRTSGEGPSGEVAGRLQTPAAAETPVDERKERH